MLLKNTVKPRYERINAEYWISDMLVVVDDRCCSRDVIEVKKKEKKEEKG